MRRRGAIQVSRTVKGTTPMPCTASAGRNTTKGTRHSRCNISVFTDCKPLFAIIQSLVSTSPSRFMICCDGCQEWLHGDCVGIGEAEGRSMERRGEEYNCPTCTSKKQRSLPADVPSEDLSEGAILASLLNVLAPTVPVETAVEVLKQQQSKVGRS